MLKEKKYKAVPKNYKGVVRLKSTNAYSSIYWYRCVKLTRGYRYTGNPDHRVVIKFYETYQDLINNNIPMGKCFIKERDLYVSRERKNNYW